MLVHLSAFTALCGLPFGHIAVPLLIWALRKDRMPFVDDQGKEAVNFQISMTLYLAAALVLSWVVVGLLLLPPLVAAWFYFVIRAAVRAQRGFTYRYPLTFRPLK